MKNNQIIWLSFAFAKLIFHLIFNDSLGFHRDEFLYMDLGQHLDFGYWSNPPMIGLIAWLGENIFGDSLIGMRMLSTLAGCILIYLVGWMAQLMGGGRWAQVLACGAFLFSPTYLRSGMFLMPVIFDVLWWTLCLFFVLRFLITDDKKQIIWFGLTCGILMLNKYSLPFLLIPLLVATLFSTHRKIFTFKETYIGLGLGLLVWMPNLIWQVVNDFPVIIHMSLLAEEQLVNMSATDFLLDQLMMNLSVALIAFPGLYFLLKKETKHLRILVLGYFGMLIMFLVFQGKSYYTLGYYPLLYAAGGVFWEKATQSVWIKSVVGGIVICLSSVFLPVAVPVMNAEKLVVYFEKITTQIPLLKNTLRWEDGNYYPLPQDFADMIDWEDMADATNEFYKTVEDKERILIYGEDYCHAGATNFFGKKYNFPPVQSFTDSYLFWIPDTISSKVDHFIYINDEMGNDVRNLFGTIDSLPAMKNPLAREYGTMVYFCTDPKKPFKNLWEQRVKEERAAWRGE